MLRIIAVASPLHLRVNKRQDNEKKSSSSLINGKKKDLHIKFAYTCTMKIDWTIEKESSEAERRKKRESVMHEREEICVVFSTLAATYAFPFYDLPISMWCTMGAYMGNQPMLNGRHTNSLCENISKSPERESETVVIDRVSETKREA